ncbi:MAG TPA: copper homeostasis protein CutC [Candidatus Acidoferrum sp.]|nr:copper homeostasis protein CutC [Candidatus Acidoferrum sp.]
MEISAETAEAAAAAERGGAHRIELCADLQRGGLTPSEVLMRRTRGLVQVPVFAMIRPRAGNFVYSSDEIEQMRRGIAEAKRLGMNGVVLGVLTTQRQVDEERTRELVHLAKPLPTTFHRAFDEVADLAAALEQVIETGATRILTSGGALSAPAGVSTLARLVAAAKERIIVLPGGGLNASNVLQVARQTGARELHSGLGSVLAYGQEDYQAFATEVRKLVGVLAASSNH